jgi:hypothetical protein
MGLREGFIDRVVSRIDRPAQLKLHWRARLRAGSLHAQPPVPAARMSPFTELRSPIGAEPGIW